MQQHLVHVHGRMRHAGDDTPEAFAHLLPAPHDAVELAAMEAALEVPQRNGSATRTRALIGTAALAMAVTMPDISLGAIAAPYSRIDLGQQLPPLPAKVWTPAASVPGPADAPVAAADNAGPVSRSFAISRTFADFDRTMPVSILAAGSERFDLAFAGVAPPSVETVTLTPIAPLAPAAPPRRERPALVNAFVAPSPVHGAPPLRAHLVDIPQISASPRPGLRPAPGLSFRTDALTPEPTPGSTIEIELAATDAALEAAFAGAIEASSAVRGAIPLAPGNSATRPQSPVQAARPPAVRAPAARAIAIREPDPQVGASAAAQAELVAKTRLDARVNGVLTGSVDFRQLDGTISIRLRSVVGILRDRFSASELEHLQTGQAIDSFITLDELQAAGIPIRYNPAYDEVEFGIDYQDAPNAAKVQVEQIGAATVGRERVGMDQIVPR